MEKLEKLPKLGLTFLYGDKLGELQRKTDDIFPLFISLRLGKKRTKIKSITANYWFNKDIFGQFNKEAKRPLRDNWRNKFIDKDTNYIKYARALYIKAHDKDFEDWDFLQNEMIQFSFNLPIVSYFSHLLEPDFKKVLRKNGLEKFSTFIYPHIYPFFILECMDEINPKALLELMKNQIISTLYDNYLTFDLDRVSLIEFLFMEVSGQLIKEIQSDLLEKTIKAIRTSDVNFFEKLNEMSSRNSPRLP